MRRLTPAELHDRIRPVLMRYTPDALKRIPRDQLIDEIVAALSGLEIIGFQVPAVSHTAGGLSDAERSARARVRLNQAALEKVAREAVTAIMAIYEVRQRP